MSDHILVCPQCLAINNVLQEAFSSLPACNDCAAQLLSESPIEVNTAEFTRFIQYSTLPVIVDFWGTWSWRSREMAGVFASLANTFKQDAVFLKVNSEQEQVLANEHKLVDIPTFILFTSGHEYHRLQGVVNEQKFHAWLERYLRIKRKKPEHRPSSI